MYRQGVEQFLMPIRLRTVTRLGRHRSGALRPLSSSSNPYPRVPFATSVPLFPVRLSYRQSLFACTGQAKHALSAVPSPLGLYPPALRRFLFDFSCGCHCGE